MGGRLTKYGHACEQPKTDRLSVTGRTSSEWYDEFAMSASDQAPPVSKSRGAFLKFALIGLAVVAAGAALTWLFSCPCGPVPGGYLFGSVIEEPVKDWSFANQVPLCQIQINAVLPHAINLNCMATPQGNLYLSCSNCEPKYWSRAVLKNPVSRLRMEGNVYPVNLTRVTDPMEMDQAWVARVKKLQVVATAQNPAVPVGTPRPERWWTFRVESR